MGIGNWKLTKRNQDCQRLLSLYLDLINGLNKNEFLALFIDDCSMRAADFKLAANVFLLHFQQINLLLSQTMLSCQNNPFYFHTGTDFYQFLLSTMAVSAEHFVLHTSRINEIEMPAEFMW